LKIKRNHTPLTLWRDLFTSVSSCVFRGAERMECGEPSPLFFIETQSGEG
jgi:hypothetical protein